MTHVDPLKIQKLWTKVVAKALGNTIEYDVPDNYHHLQVHQHLFFAHTPQEDRSSSLLLFKHKV